MSNERNVYDLDEEYEDKEDEEVSEEELQAVDELIAAWRKRGFDERYLTTILFVTCCDQAVELYGNRVVVLKKAIEIVETEEYDAQLAFEQIASLVVHR